MFTSKKIAEQARLQVRLLTDENAGLKTENAGLKERCAELARQLEEYEQARREQLMAEMRIGAQFEQMMAFTGGSEGRAVQSTANPTHCERPQGA